MVSSISTNLLAHINKELDAVSQEIAARKTKSWDLPPCGFRAFGTANCSYLIIGRRHFSNCRDTMSLLTNQLAPRFAETQTDDLTRLIVRSSRDHLSDPVMSRKIKHKSMERSTRDSWAAAQKPCSCRKGILVVAIAYHQPTHRKGYSRKRDYLYHAEQDRYECPAGQVL